MRRYIREDRDIYDREKRRYIEPCGPHSEHQIGDQVYINLGCENEERR